MKHATSFQLSEEALKLLAQMAAAMGISKTGVVEFAIRELAKRQKK